MSFLDSSTAVIDVILTTKGRELLARNDGSFKITKFALGDDEINYQLWDATDTESPDKNVLTLPVLEPSSNPSVGLRYRLVTAPKGTLKLPILELTPENAQVIFGSDATFSIITKNGEDPDGYSISSRDEDIGKPTDTDIPVVNGESTATIRSGSLAGGKTGTVTIDVLGKSTGARDEFELTVSASAS